MDIKKIEAKASKARHLFVAGAFATIGVVAGLVIYNEGRKDGYSEAINSNLKLLNLGVYLDGVMDDATDDENGITFQVKHSNSEDTELFHINHVK